MTDTLPPPVQAILTAAGAGDTPGFLASFTPHGVVDDWGREFRGAEAIQGWSDAEFIGVQRHARGHRRRDERRHHHRHRRGGR